MTSRERVIEAINHRKPDRVPVDLAATCVTGISATAYWNLRKALGLPEKVSKIYNMLEFISYIDDDVREKLGVDTVPLGFPSNSVGNSMLETKEFVSPTGIPALISKYDEWDTLLIHQFLFNDFQGISQKA